MNTYVQDENIPIYISLQYAKNFMKFPINPEHLKIDRSSESVKEDIEGLGEIAIPQSPGLARIEISSFFWHQNNLLPSASYVAWLKKWQKSRKPANLIVTRLNYSMQVVCDEFSYDTRAGEEKDVYFDLRLTEYKPYGARRLGVKTNESLREKLRLANAQMYKDFQQAEDYLTPPVLVEIPRPSRSSASKKQIENPYITKENDTICGITKSITGSTDGWKDLYDMNIKQLGETIADGGDLPVGISLTLPDKWIGGDA
ncbi:MAG: hypothetical protein NC548_59120 [Lachnospiraceae bacterium]|nr:hypothetical protein [Lachnospiraceae bacterium]